MEAGIFFSSKEKGEGGGGGGGGKKGFQFAPITCLFTLFA